MKRKYVINGAIAALLLVGGALLWLRPFSSAGHDPVGLDKSALSSEPSHISPDSPSSAAVEASQVATAPTRPAAEPTGVPSAAQVYGDSKLPLGERFRLLLERADLGSQAAARLSAVIAIGCNAINGLAPGTPSFGADEATEYQRLIDRQLRDNCREVLLNPAFQKTIDTLRGQTANTYSESVKQAIRRAYAERGAEAGLIVGIGELKWRPDEATAIAVAGEFAELEISSVYLAPLMHSSGALTPQNRDALVTTALQFLACDFGRPCGPTSFDVGMLCLTLGACIPGADYQTVFTRELITAQDARDVQAILARLRRIMH